jgi:hypothetical protein
MNNGARSLPRASFGSGGKRLGASGRLLVPEPKSHTAILLKLLRAVAHIPQ